MARALPFASRPNATTVALLHDQTGPHAAVRTARAAEALVAAGCRVTVLAESDTLGHARLDVPVNRLPRVRSHRSRWRSELARLRQWRRALDGVADDAIIWTESPLPGTAAVLAGRRHQLLYRPMTCAGADTDLARRYADCPPHRTTVWLDRYAYRHAHTVITPSHNMREQFGKAYGLRRRAFAVPLAVTHTRPPLSRIDARQRWRIAPTAFVVGVHAPMDALCGLELLLQAVGSGVLGDHGRLLLVGEGSRQSRAERLAARLGVLGRVVWAGDQPDPWQAYAAMDVMVSTCACDRPGDPLRHAMAAELPVLARRRDGLRVLTSAEELIHEGQTGVTVHPHDPHDLAAHIAAFVSDPAWCRQMGERARQVALSRTWQHVVQDTLSLAMDHAMAPPTRESLAA